MTSIACGIIDGYYMHWFIFRMLLLHFGHYFHRIHIHSHFSLGLYQILRPFQLSIHFCSDFTCLKGYFWINFDVLGKNFVMLRVSGQNINGKYYSNACMVSLFLTLYKFKLSLVSTGFSLSVLIYVHQWDL